MSLILEALRKSEAERRRGVAPDVAMELPPPAAARTARVPAWRWPAVALLVVLLGTAWWWGQRDEPTRAPAPASDASVVLAPVVAPLPAEPVVVTRPAPPPAMPPSLASPRPAASPVAPPVTANPVPQPMPPPAAVAPAPDIAHPGMPPVKVSMHLWDESSAKRFVILDGQRMGEGDRNGDLVVVAIERDGVVVERHGQRARVPLP